MPLPNLNDLDFKNKRVLLRTNYDVPIKDGQITDTRRIDESFKTIEVLLQKGASKIIILSHLGRPDGQVVPEMSLQPVSEYIDHQIGSKIRDNCEVYLRENLRFNPGEETNDPHFVQDLVELGDVFVNDAFACCHRNHASIVGIPEFLPSVFGLDCQQEIETLTRVHTSPKRPVVAIFGGAKEDKLEAAAGLSKWVDTTLVGGLLPQFAEKFNLKNSVLAQLREDGKDITLESVKLFQSEIAKAGTIIWAGPMGIYEQVGCDQGTREIAQAVSDSLAYKVIGGGDTEAALQKFNLIAKMDYISSGGGAMLEFLAKGTLPGIEAIIKK